MYEPNSEEKREAQRRVRESYPALVLGLFFWNSPLVCWSLIVMGYDVVLLATWLVFLCVACGVIWLTCSTEECVGGRPECNVQTSGRMWVMLLGQVAIFAVTWTVRYLLLKAELIFGLGG